MIRLEMKNYNILTEKQQKYLRYYQLKLINMISYRQRNITL